MQNIGKIVQIIGAVVDIRFPKESLPKLLNAIEINNNDKKNDEEKKCALCIHNCYADSSILYKRYTGKCEW